MDSWGIGIFVISVILYFVTKKKYTFFILTSGIGIGIIVGAVWVYYALQQQFSKVSNALNNIQVPVQMSVETGQQTNKQFLVPTLQIIEPTNIPEQNDSKEFVMFKEFSGTGSKSTPLFSMPDCFARVSWELEKPDFYIFDILNGSTNFKEYFSGSNTEAEQTGMKYIKFIKGDSYYIEPQMIESNWKITIEIQQ